jgi:hypothetical protein
MKNPRKKHNEKISGNRENLKRLKNKQSKKRGSRK